MADKANKDDRLSNCTPAGGHPRNYDPGFDKTEWWGYAVREDEPATGNAAPRYRLISTVLDTREEAVDACKHIPASREPIIVKCERVFPSKEE